MLSKRKRRKNSAVSLGRSENIHIGIMGLSESVDTTTIGLALASYLSEIKDYKVAYIDVSSRKSIGYLSRLDNVTKESEDGFSIGKLDFIDGKLTEEIYSCKYDVDLFDYGFEKYPNASNFVNMTIKILVGSMQCFKQDTCIKSLEKILNISGSDTWVYIIQGEEKEIAKLAKKYEIMVLQMPYIENSMKQNNISVEFFEKII